jgi:8-oxo-dGTP pyrophosphatase MutT (NUDIX family)
MAEPRLDLDTEYSIGAATDGRGGYGACREEEMKTIHYQAAGGVVVRGERVLVLRRPSRNEVRLPKGHIEPGESRRETALREVTEESGYAELQIAADLGHQQVEFDYQGQHVVRDEYYFAMQLEGTHQGAREAKELQFEPVWLRWQEALEALTYEVEREWVERAKAALSA